MKPRSYKEAGVDIEREEQTIASLAAQLTFRRKGLGAPMDLWGYFTGLIEFREFALTLNTDGVGTKLLVARDVGRWDTVGIDCVAMNVNDALCVGAEPLAMVDYFAVDAYDEAVARQVGEGLNRGAEMANVTMVGGEIATIPEIVRSYDLAGTCLGYVRKENVVDGRSVEPGQVLVGLPSSGLHSNGYTLARKVLAAQEIGYGERVAGTDETWGDALLRPTEVYVREVLQVLHACGVTGLAHVTGGGFRKVGRIRKDMGFEIADPPDPPPVFEALQEAGEVDLEEMYRTFNMGLGFVLVLPESEVDEALDILNRHRKASVIGSVREGDGVEIPDLALRL